MMSTSEKPTIFGQIQGLLNKLSQSQGKLELFHEEFPKFRNDPADITVNELSEMRQWIIKHLPKGK